MSDVELIVEQKTLADGSVNVAIWAIDKPTAENRIADFMRDIDINGGRADFYGPLRITGGYVAFGNYKEEFKQ